LSKQNNPSSTTSVKSATRESHSISRPMTQDLWGNLIFFLIVSIAICFVLVNNTLSQLMTTTGIVVLSVLFFLDLFAIVPLVRILFVFISFFSREKRR